MNCLRALSIATFGVACLGCSSSDDAKEPEQPSSATMALDLGDVKTNPDDYTWFDFRPNVKKLILAGAAETEHMRSCGTRSRTARWGCTITERPSPCT